MRRLNSHEQTLIVVWAVFMIIVLAASANGCRTDEPVKDPRETHYER